MIRPDLHLDNDEASRLYAVARAMTAALGPDEVVTAVFEHALAELGASTAGFWLLHDDAIHFAAGAGHLADSPGRVGPIPLGSDLPAAECVRDQTVVSYASVAERDRRWPTLTGIPSVAGAVVVLPLVASGRTLGCLHVGYPESVDAGDIDVAELDRFAELSAVALDRSQRFEVEREHREQLQFFADATGVLIRSLDPAEVVQLLVAIAVPRLADFCAVLIPEQEELRMVAARMGGTEAVTSSELLPTTFSLQHGSAPARCFRTGKTQTTDESLAMPGLETALGSGLLIPISWAGHPIGVLWLGFVGGDDAWPALLRATAEGLALRAGVALRNARMYDEERRVAATLVEALLPATLPEIPGYECAVRYLPAAGDVAGDWYDVLDLGGRVLLGVGDAAGHGIPAATLMAELRNSARGLAAAGLAPHEMLDTLSVLVDAAGDELFATAIYGTLDPATHTLEWATAGHPPPALLRGGAVELLERPDVDTGPPIASGLAGSHSPRQLRLDAGDTLVLFTDGVIERRGDDVESGLARLLAVLAGSADATAAAIADGVVVELCADATDDCSVLVLRRTR